MRNFGVEFEYAGGAGGVLSYLVDEGLAVSDDFHAYHCRCHVCTYDNYVDGSLFFAQEDCTADGEIITRILRYGSDDANKAISTIAKGVISARAAVDGEVGMHVHVDATDLSDADKVRVCRIFVRYQEDIGLLASGHNYRVRGYNSMTTEDTISGAYRRRTSAQCRHNVTTYARYAENPNYSEADRAYYRQIADDWQRSLDEAVLRERDDVGWWDKPADEAEFHNPCGWLSGGYDTFEFRVWNAVRNEWRIRMAVGVSVAIVQAAADGVDVSREDERSLLDIIAPHVDADIFGGIVRQLTYKENVA